MVGAEGVGALVVEAEGAATTDDTTVTTAFSAT